MKKSRLIMFLLLLIGLVLVAELCKNGFDAGFNDATQNREHNK